MIKIITLFAIILFPLHNVFAQIEGTVENRSGKGLPGITVNAIDNTGNTVATDQSNEQGYFSFSGLKPGKYKIKITAVGFRPVLKKDIVVNEGDQGPIKGKEDYFIANRLDIVLSTDMTHYQIEGQVIDQTEKGQPNISLSIADTADKVLATTKSDNLGFFGFKGLQPGNYKIEAKTASFRPAIYYVKVKEAQKEAEGEEDVTEATWLYVVLRPASKSALK